MCNTTEWNTHSRIHALTHPRTHSRTTADSPQISVPRVLSGHRICTTSRPIDQNKRGSKRTMLLGYGTGQVQDHRQLGTPWVLHPNDQHSALFVKRGGTGRIPRTEAPLGEGRNWTFAWDRRGACIRPTLARFARGRITNQMPSVFAPSVGKKKLEAGQPLAMQDPVKKKGRRRNLVTSELTGIVQFVQGSGRDRPRGSIGWSLSDSAWSRG